MATSAERRNVNISIANNNADFIKSNGINLSKAVDMLIKEMRRKKMREEWAIENREALDQRCRVLESEGGTASERLYGVLTPEDI